MNKLFSTLCAGALTMAMAATAFVPAQAAPVFVPKAPQTTNSDVVQVQDWRWRRGQGADGRYGGRNFEAPRGNWNRDGRRGFYRDNYSRDHYRRDHYRGNNLGGAVIGGLITGAIVGGVLNNSRPVYRDRVYRGTNAHVQWCFDRYRTYRASDNTYVPRVGVRAYCNSPYN